MLKILIVGQTPPPYGGQAVMIQKLLDGKFDRVKLFHVRMAFSKEMDEIGKFRYLKLFHLLNVIYKIVYKRLRYNIDVLYYPPAGPDKIPMYRDLAILINTRWLFKHTIFHFHAGGISKLYLKLSPVLKCLFRCAYFKPDVAIRLSSRTPRDGHNLKTKYEFIVPYGIEDKFKNTNTKERMQNSGFEILYVGVLRESKGVLVLLEAANILRERGLDFRINFVGKFASKLFGKKVYERIDLYGLESQVKFSGVLIGKRKWKAFARADIFCFPTYFESETFGIVILEAMQFALPVVSTRWRGIPSIIRNTESGYLVSIKDSRAIADKIEIFIKHPAKAKQMGQKGRQLFLGKYTIDKYYKNMEKVYLSVSKMKRAHESNEGHI